MMIWQRQGRLDIGGGALAGLGSQGKWRSEEASAEHNQVLRLGCAAQGEWVQCSEGAHEVRHEGAHSVLRAQGRSCERVSSDGGGRTLFLSPNHFTSTLAGNSCTGARLGA